MARFSRFLSCLEKSWGGQSTSRCVPMNKHLETQAAQALRETLNQISVIRVKEIKVESGGRADKTLVASIEIDGHPHVLVCKVSGSSDSEHLRRALLDLKELQEHFPGAPTPVLIAPTLCEELQARCRDCNTGFLDLEGNARLYLDEVFIVKRSLPPKTLPPQAESLPTRETAHFAHLA